MLTKIEYTDKAKQALETTPALQQANRRLEELVKSPYITVAAEWDRTDDGKTPFVYQLRLFDGPDSGTIAFTPEDLASSSRLPYLLWRAWDTFLQARSHRLLKSLHEDNE